MATKTYNELLDELEEYNTRTKLATETYEDSLGSLQEAVDVSTSAKDAATTKANEATASALVAKNEADRASQVSGLDTVEDAVDYALGGGYVNQAQEELISGKIFPISGVLKNGDTVPSGTTHHRVLIGGKSTIVAMSPVVSGVVSLLTETGATIGGAFVDFININTHNSLTHRDEQGAHPASAISTKTSGSTQDFIDAFALKIFQSPTDAGLTEIKTRTLTGGEVYEVHKTSDDSLATIYSDAAGTTEIVQNGADNKSGSDGGVEFYISDGGYYVEVGGVKSNFEVNVLRKALANPDMGAAMVARGVVAVDSIADLLALSEGQRRENLRYLVKGYHAGSVIGGGVFSWSPTAPRSGHNGGTVISPSVDWNGSEATFEAFVLATDNSGLYGCFVREGYNILDVDFFGPFKSPTSDDSPALDAFTKALAATPTSAQLIGDFYPSRSIQISGVSYRNFFTDLNIFPKPSVVEDVLTFVDCNEMHQIGHLRIVGHGGVNFDWRTARHGLVVTGNNNGSTFDKIVVRFMRGNGVTCIGKNAMGGFNHIISRNNGASPQGSVQKVSINFSDVVNEGGAGSAAQTSTLTISGFDTSKILPYAYLAYQDELYLIQSVTENSISVSPFLPIGTTSGVVTLAQGAGLYIAGSDTSKIRVGTLDTMVCGFGLQDHTLYPATVQNLVAQYCGAGAIISRAGQAAIGSVIVSGYFEANMLDWVKGTSSNSFSASVGLSVTLNPKKIKAIGARHTTIANYNYYTTLQGTLITIMDKTLDGQYDPMVYSFSDNPGVGRVLLDDTATIPIEIEDWKILLFRHEINTYTIYGTGEVGQPTGDVTLTVPDGFTINGEVGPLVISGSTKPVRITVSRIRHQWYAPGTDYVVTYENT